MLFFVCFLKILFKWRPFIKVFNEFVTIELMFYVLAFGHEACGILAP